MKDGHFLELLVDATIKFIDIFVVAASKQPILMDRLDVRNGNHTRLATKQLQYSDVKDPSHYGRFICKNQRSI